MAPCLDGPLYICEDGYLRFPPDSWLRRSLLCLSSLSWVDDSVLFCSLGQSPGASIEWLVARGYLPY